jgi:hypothetical protein
MTKTVVCVLALICVLAAVGLAADISGKWSAQVPGRDGQAREQVFTFKVAGDAVTGTMSAGQAGEAPIADGKLSGDTLTFTVTREMGGNSVKWNFTGKIAGDEIKLKREGGQGQPREFTAKRVK